MKFPMVFALTGLAQGGLLWAITRMRMPGPGATMALTALLYAVIAVPLVVYCTQGLDRLPPRMRRATVAGYGLAFALLGGYTAWAHGAMSHPLDLPPTTALATFVLGFVSLQLLCGFDFDARRWDYRRLFQASWRNGLLLATSAAMTGLVWLVLLTGAGLMKLIGLRWVMSLITEPAFALPVTGLVAAGAFALGLSRMALTESIRRFWLSISAWLLPLVLAFGVLWVLMLPWTGLDALLDTGKAASLMLGFTALAGVFANCAYQDGRTARPYPRWLGRATQLAWLSLLPVVAIAWWALGQRITQHGLSEQRLWALLAAALVAFYAVGYALSWLRPSRWMSWIARTNIAAALALCGGLLVFLTPVGNVQRLAVNGHLRHLATAGKDAEPDWTYLRWQSGRFGREALGAMAATGEGVPPGRPWARQAGEVLAQTSQYAAEPARTELNAQTLQEHFSVHPRGKALPESFRRYVETESDLWDFRECLESEAGCAFWLGDLNGDGADEVAMFHKEPDRHGALFRQTGGQWARAGQLAPEEGWTLPDVQALDQAQPVPAQWRDLRVGGQRLRVELGDY